MKTSDFGQTMVKLGQEAARIEDHAREVSVRFQMLCRKTESLKMGILTRGLESRRKSLARQAGLKSIARDGKKLGVSLAAAAAGIVLGGVLTRDGLSALTVGMSGFDGALQELGKSKWAVSLDRDLLVIHRNQIAPGRTWVTLESLLLALEDLREKACAGEQFGNIGSVAAKLKQGQSKLDHLLPITQWVAVSQVRRTKS